MVGGREEGVKRNVGIVIVRHLFKNSQQYYIR